MKYIFGSFIVIGFIVGAIWFFSALPNADLPRDNDEGFAELPTGETYTSPVPFVSSSSQNTDMFFDKLLASPDITPDPNNSGVYLLHENPEGERHDFIIEYHESDQTIHVLIQSQPIQFVRQAAETRLQVVLGMSQRELCNLRYQVIVPYWVSERYAGQNIGFSSCPGAVQF